MTRHNPFGGMLRRWRRARRISQLQLALVAGVSSRHLSFLETGRAQPGRRTLLRLARALQMPLRDQNALLGAAGYAPLYRETPLDSPEMRQIRRVISFWLRQLEPYPAVLTDRHWTILTGNRAHGAMLQHLARNAPDLVRANLMRLAFHPDGLRPIIANWDVVGRVLMDRIHREFSAAPDDRTRALLDELLAYPGIPAPWADPDLGSPPPILLHMHLRTPAQDLRLCTMITTIGAAQDVTLQELRIESFFPLDVSSDRALRAIMARAQRQAHDDSGPPPREPAVPSSFT